MATPSVLVAIPTAGKRDSLYALLDYLADFAPTSRFPFRIVVLENSPTQSSVLRQRSEQGGFTLIHVPEPGLARVRNAGLAAARAVEYLIFIDDDEVPVAPWPEALILEAQRSGADVVLGPVEAKGFRAPHRWSPSASLLRPTISEPAGTFQGEVYAGNTLLRMSTVITADLRFDEAFDRSGGEDTDFFRRLRNAGASVSWSPEAVVTELLDDERLGLRWYLRRRMAEGGIDWNLSRTRDGGRGRSVVAFRRAGRAARGAGNAIAGLVSDDSDRTAGGLGDIALSLGSLRAAFGWAPSDYAPRRTNDGSNSNEQREP